MIAIIIVFFNNDPINLNQFNHLANIGNTSVIIVDNTPNRDLDIKLKNIYYIPLKNNKGIAFAQNTGIEKAKQLGCKYIIFFDQDSEIKLSYPNEIVDEYNRIKSFIPNLFLLGPTIINGRNNNEYKSAIKQDKETNGFKPRLDIISSGSCIESSNIDSIGGLEDNLFIDCVDQEWCWRANYKGYISGITSNIKLIHYVGQTEYKFLGVQIIVSSPFRYYYQTRNWIWLLRRKYVPLRWKFNTSIKKIFYPLIFPFITKSWLMIYRNIWRGFKDGLINSK